MPERLEDIFPNLQNASYEITSECSIQYNCTAWAAGDTQRRWWPFPRPFTYWPRGVEREETVYSFVAAFRTLRYIQCDNNRYEPGVEKLAIYVDSAGKPTHIARQLGSGRWTSKLGDLEDIEHETLGSLEGREYGRVAVILERRRGESE